jgi:hypothetical protein
VLVSAIDVALPEQTVCTDGVAITEGIGLTVIVAVAELPVQLPTDGVMVYIAVPALEPVVVNVCVMLLPEFAEAPLTPDWFTVHEKVVPLTLLVKLTEVALPEHKVCEAGVTVTTGVGLTVTLTVCAAPGQLPPVDVGVTVYITSSELPVELIKVLLITLVVCVVVLSPVVFGLSVAIQVYPETTLLVSVKFTAPPLQMVALFTLVIAGVGLTVTETL